MMNFSCLPLNWYRKIQVLTPPGVTSRKRPRPSRIVYRFDVGPTAWSSMSVRGASLLVFRLELFFFVLVGRILVSSVKIDYTTPPETNWRLNADRLVPNVTERYRTLKLLFAITYEESPNIVGSARTPNYFPMQKVEKIRFRMSSGVVWPVRESRAQSAR